MKIVGYRTMLGFVATIAVSGVFFACDPAVTVHIARRDLRPITCPNNVEMTYTVIIQYKDGERYEDSFEVDKKIGHPTFGVLPGSMERQISWVQCKLYCGESKPPVLVTPQIILPDDLIKKDDRNYYYYIDRVEAPEPKNSGSSTH